MNEPVRLYGFGPALGLADPSPFVLKVWCFFELAGTPFEYKGTPMNLRRAPKGKLPFVESEGQLLADSAFILEHYAGSGKVSLPVPPESRRAALRLALRALENDFYWCLLYWRWSHPSGWAQARPELFSNLPPGVRQLLPQMARRKLVSALKYQGTGRHAEEDILKLASQQLQDLSVLLEGQAFFSGERPGLLDAGFFAALAQVILADFDSPLNDSARTFKPLVDYCERMRVACPTAVTRPLPEPTSRAMSMMTEKR